MDRRRMMAFDTGPGNVMLDHAARVLLGKPYDADGAAAARGKVDEELLSRLLEHDFFHRRPPRSAWRLDFGSSFADKHIAENRNLTPEVLRAQFGERDASASASPSLGPGNRILRAETGGGFRAQNAGERPEFCSQTALRLANRPKLRKPPRFAGTAWWRTQSSRTSLRRPNFADNAARLAVIEFLGRARGGFPPSGRG